MQACSSDKAKQNVAKSLKADTLLFTQEGTNVTINYTDSGHLKASIFSPSLIGFKKDGNDIVKMPKGVKGDFFNRAGLKESMITAEKGISYQSKKITEQNVQLENVEKDKELLKEKTIIEQFPLNTQCIYIGKIDNKTLGEIDKMGYVQIFPPLLAVAVLMIVLLFTGNLG